MDAVERAQLLERSWEAVAKALEERCRAHERRLVEAGVCPNCGEQIAHVEVIAPGSACACGFDFHPYAGTRPLIGSLFRRILELRYRSPATLL